MSLTEMVNAIIHNVNQELDESYHANDIRLKVNADAFKKNSVNVTWRDEFQSRADFINDAKCLLIKPAVHLYLSYKHFFDAWLKLGVAVAQLLTGSPALAWAALQDSAFSFFKTYLYFVTACLQAVGQVISLLARTVISGFHRVYLMWQGAESDTAATFVAQGDNVAASQHVQQQIMGFMSSLNIETEINRFAVSDDAIKLQVGERAITRAPNSGPGRYPEFKRLFQPVPGAVTFLDEFQSWEDFQNDLKCLLIKPMLCFYLLRVHTSNTFYKLWVAFAQLVTGSPYLAMSAAIDAGASFVKTCLYSGYFTLLIAMQVLSLLSRITLTIIDAVARRRSSASAEATEPHREQPQGWTARMFGVNSTATSRQTDVRQGGNLTREEMVLC